MCMTDPASNPRPRRTHALLVDTGYEVDLLSYATQLAPVGKVFQLARPDSLPWGVLARRALSLGHLMLRRIVPVDAFRDWLHLHRLGIAGWEPVLAASSYDLIVVEDLYLLPLAQRVRGSARLVFDAREFYPRQNDENLWFRISERPERERICRMHLPKCDVVMTVSPGLVDAYDQHFGVRPRLVMSVPWYQDLSPIEPQADRFRLVHMGIANPNRQLEKMIDIVAALDDRFTLDFYLTGSPDYIELLAARAAGVGHRIRVLPPVAFDAIVPTLHEYDIGLFYVEPVTFNLRHALPNKLFEFIQARLMVAIGPSPDMARVVREFDCGVVADRFDPAAMIAALSRVTTADVRRAKQRSDAAARVLCFEEVSKQLRVLLGLDEEAPRSSAA